MLYEMKVEEFLNVLGSNSSAPGGGSVAALAGALAASLVGMVGKLSDKSEDQGEIQKIIPLADNLAVELKELIEKDTQAFNQVMKAFKMPKNTPEEKTARSHAIQQGMKDAVLVPLEVMEKSVKAMELASEIAKIGNQNAISDAGVAGLMGNAAVKGAAYNVQINLLSVKDDDFKREKADLLNQIKIKADRILLEVEHIVEKAIGV